IRHHQLARIRLPQVVQFFRRRLRVEQRTFIIVTACCWTVCSSVVAVVGGGGSGFKVNAVAVHAALFAVEVLTADPFVGEVAEGECDGEHKELEEHDDCIEKGQTNAGDGGCYRSAQ